MKTFLAPTTVLLVLLVTLLAPGIRAQDPTPLATPGTIIVGTDYHGKGYCLISQLLDVGIGNGGVWLTPCEYCTEHSGAINFVTRSQFFDEQVNFRVNGEFSAPEGNGKILVLDGSIDYLPYLMWDNILTSRLTTAFAKYGKKERAGELIPLSLNMQAQPTLYTNVTAMSYNMAYGKWFTSNPPNWPAQFMLMLQALTSCTSNPLQAFCPEVAQVFTPQLLQLKSNEYNKNKWCDVMDCDKRPHLPTLKTAFINGNPICSQD